MTANAALSAGWSCEDRFQVETECGDWWGGGTLELSFNVLRMGRTFN